MVEGDILQAALQEVTGGTPPPVAEGEEGAGVEEGGAGQQERDDAGQATTLPEASVGDGATGSDGGNVRYVTAGASNFLHAFRLISRVRQPIFLTVSFGTAERRAAPWREHESVSENLGI